MLQLLLIAFLLNQCPDAPWEPTPTHKIAIQDTVQNRDEFKPLQWLILSSISIYRRTWSRAQGDVCNFVPSCSQYGYQAIKKYGFFFGGLMAADRMERCNYSCWRYYPQYYDVKWVEGRGLKLYDPPERNWLFMSGAGRIDPSQDNMRPAPMKGRLDLPSRS